MVDVVLFLVQPIYPPRELISAQTSMMGDLGHLSIISQHILLCHLVVGVINLLLLRVIP